MKLYFLFMALTISGIISAQTNNIKWDDTESNDWPAECKIITITSSLDQKPQSAYFYQSTSNNPKPLVISLHTWSNGFVQKDPLAQICIDKNFTYIHPDFRGRNNNPEACGSKFAIQDIEDAISFGLTLPNVDPSEVHVIGTSGGGYSTLLTYMNTKHKVKTFSAWVPISDIEKWFYESQGRGNRYALDIAMCTNPGKTINENAYTVGIEEARKRSPIYMKTPTSERKNCQLFIYSGVHDGYTGSVPVSQSLNMYNKLVHDFDPSATNELIPEKDIIEILSSQSYQRKNKGTIADRVIHYERHYKNLVNITIFEGTHEMLSEIALDHIK